MGLGEVLWDIFGGQRHLGGAPANFACHAQAQGLRALLLSAVGKDRSGRELAEALGKVVECRLQAHPYATGEVDIRVDGQGVPSYCFRPDCAWDHLAATQDWLELARRTRLACFGTLAQRSAGSREAIHAFLAAMPQGADCWRVLDINLRQHFYTDAIVRDSLRVADALKINDEELETIARREGFCGLPQLVQARALMERYGLRLLILSCGALGSHVLTAEGCCHYEPAAKVRVVDSVGAGDAFTATFFACLLRGEDIITAQRAATRAAACVCTQPGAMPPMPQTTDLGR